MLTWFDIHTHTFTSESEVVGTAEKPGSVPARSLRLMFRPDQLSAGNHVQGKSHLETVLHYVLLVISYETHIPHDITLPS